MNSSPNQPNEIQSERQDPTRCGSIALLGAPNAGKSTLLNRLVGGKVAIVTPKAQTTRNRVAGICMEENTQLIFLDLPGVFDATQRFEQAMVKAAWAAVKEADQILLLVDAASYGKHNLPTHDTDAAVAKLKQQGRRAVLALNKTDVAAKEQLLELAQAFDATGVFTTIFMISADTGSGVEDVKKYLAAQLPEGPFLYDPEQMSDIQERQLAAEVTREQLFLKLSQELPYSLAVESETWEERRDGSVKINQTIYVQRDSQKSIVLGEKGSMLKAIGSNARQEMERIFDRKVHLFLFVKVKADWKERKEFFSTMGLEY